MTGTGRITKRGDYMADATTIATFIAEIAPCAQYAYKLLGKVRPSVCIGMACVESGFGTSETMRNHHAFLGQKVGTGRTATKYWDGTFFNSKTKEEYVVGKHTIIRSDFRSYKTTLQCILNYYELLNSSLYRRVKADADYTTQMKQIKEVGYMTSSTEVNSVIKLIKTYNLTFYDSVVGDTNPYTLSLKLMKECSKGESVKWLQWQLNKNGANLAIDGCFGKHTKLAVLLYQKDNGLVVDGIVGARTIESLYKKK